MTSIPNDESIDQNIIYKYTIVAKMGSGAYGHVWKAIDKSTGLTYALKKVYSAFQNQLDAERTFRQISILKKLNHPNVVKLQKIFRAKNQLDIYLLFEFIQSDLFKTIKQNLLDENHKKYIVYQIAKSLKYIHSAGVLHRDIKPSNVLIDSACKIKLCDFGLSRTTFSYNETEPIITEFIATRWYRAPQVMLGSKCYTSKSDIWSFGCLIYQMFAYKALLAGKDNIHQIQKLLEFKGYPNDEEKRSLKVNGIDKILGHFTVEKKDLSEYFGKIDDPKLWKLLNKMFEYDPNKRPSAQEILQSSFLEGLQNYEPEPISQIKIQLEHSENIKLKADEYKQLIYGIFQQKQPETVKPQLKMIESDNIHHRSVIQRTLKKKFSHMLRNSASVSVLEPISKMQNLQQVPQKETMKNIPQNLPLESKVNFISEHTDSKQQNSKHSLSRHRREMSEQVPKTNSSIIMKKSMPLEINKLGAQRYKKRTIKQSSLHEEDKENPKDHIQENQKKNHKDKTLKKDFIPVINLDRKSQNKKSLISLQHSPLKSQISVSKHNPSKQSPYTLKIQKPNKINQTSNPRSKISKSFFKNSISLHSSMHTPQIHEKQKDKLPQLIIKPRNKIITTTGKQDEIHEAKPFNEIGNVRKSEGVGVRLKGQSSFIDLKSKKIQKKGVALLYNKVG